MVFFICSHCGSSLKKNKVDKHYAVQCRNVPQVSCMDCHKEFSGNDYVAHTKCITEDEKYSAKGFIPKPNSNKGECKQQEWLDVVREVQHSQENLPKNLKNLLNSVVSFENIPRKKPKFVNFLKNNNLKFSINDLDQLWDLLEKEYKRVKENAQTPNTNENAEKQSEISTEEANKDPEVAEKQDGNLSLELDQKCEGTPKDKTKKKKKNRAEITNNSENLDENLQGGEQVHVNTSMEVDQVFEVTPKGKTKKKKNKAELTDDSEKQANESLEAEKLNGNCSMEVDNECEGAPKETTKQKKNKKNRAEVTIDSERQTGEDLQAPEKQNENTTTEVNLETQTTPRGKTQNSKHKSENKTTVVDNHERHGPEETLAEVPLTKKQIKEKKKREKYEAELKEIESSKFSDLPPEEEDDDDDQNKNKKKSKKHKGINGLVSNVNGVTGDQSGEISVKTKKKRQLDDDQPPEPPKKKKKQTEGDEQAEETRTAEYIMEENTNSLQKFQWNEIILKVVRSKGGEIPVKRLRKKVVTEYQNCCDSAESEEKLIIKFNKKLPKVPGITVYKEVVKLME